MSGTWVIFFLFFPLPVLTCSEWRLFNACFRFASCLSCFLRSAQPDSVSKVIVLRVLVPWALFFEFFFFACSALKAKFASFLPILKYSGWILKYLSAAVSVPRLKQMHFHSELSYWWHIVCQLANRGLRQVDGVCSFHFNLWISWCIAWMHVHMQLWHLNLNYEADINKRFVWLIR